MTASPSTLTTDWSRSLGLRVPIANAPMGGAAGGRLAAAVAAAGGLGMIGMGSSATAAALRTELEVLRTEPTGPPFGIGLVDWVMRADPDLLAVALDAGPAVLSVSFGSDFDWVRRAHDRGVLAVTQVGSVAEARAAVAAGIDVVVARGGEGGGHGSPAVGTLPLLCAVLDTVDVPVLAAGGIGTPRAVAAALAAGAAGVWVGTLFAACAEALTDPAARASMVAAGETDTVTTTAFDREHGYPWPARFPERVIAADGAPTPVNAGQGVGAVTTVRPAAAVIADLDRAAGELLRRW